jgi:hypothetical protein
MTRWTHADGTADHAPDPHYNGNGLPAFWTCHVALGKGVRCWPGGVLMARRALFWAACIDAGIWAAVLLVATR